jgi:hypothetical protein
LKEGPDRLTDFGRRRFVGDLESQVSGEPRP